MPQEHVDGTVVLQLTHVMVSILNIFDFRDRLVGKDDLSANVFDKRYKLQFRKISKVFEKFDCQGNIDLYHSIQGLEC